MKLRTITAGIMAVTLMYFTTPAISHTSITSTSPDNGSVLEKSPSVIEIRFEHATRITSVILHQDGKAERKLLFTPETSSTTFELPEPGLGRGDNEIEWKALSADGHVISGTLNYTVKSDVTGSD